MPWVWAGTQPWRHQWISCWGNPGHRHTAPTGCGTATESSVSQVYSQAEQTQNTIRYSIYTTLWCLRLSFSHQSGILTGRTNTKHNTLLYIYNFMMLGTLIFTSVKYTHRQNKHKTQYTTLYTTLWCSGLSILTSVKYKLRQNKHKTQYTTLYTISWRSEL